MAAIDRRSVGYRELKAWREALERDLGGLEGLSTQRRTLVELCCRLRLYLDHIDGFLADCPSLVRKRTKSLLPIVKERQALSDSLARLLKELGLERQEKPVKGLAEYLKQREEGVKDEAETEHPGGDAGRKDFGEDVQAAVGEGHVEHVENISERAVRATDDGGAEEAVREIHRQE
jgi:hypothetical protein